MKLLKALLVIAAAALAVTASAQFLYQEDGQHTFQSGNSRPLHSFAFGSGPASVLGTARTPATNSVVPLNPKTGFELSISLQSTNPSAASTGTAYFDLSVDGQKGSNFTTTATGLIALPFTLNGTNPVVVATNVPVAIALNHDWVKYTAVTNAGATSNRVDINAVRCQYLDP